MVLLIHFLSGCGIENHLKNIVKSIKTKNCFISTYEKLKIVFNVYYKKYRCSIEIYLSKLNLKVLICGFLLTALC